MNFRTWEFNFDHIPGETTRDVLKSMMASFGAQCVDHIGPIGPVVGGCSPEDAAFRLGALYGARPQDFARPLEEIEAPVENI